MAKRSGTITLQSFLHKYFIKEGVDEDQFVRYYTILADGLRELAIHHLPVAATSTLTVDIASQTASFPDDFIDYVFIAIERGGRWWIFTRDDDMVDKTIEGITGTDLSDKISIIGPGGIGGKNIRWFQPDYENRRFLFNGVTSSDVVVIKYQSTGVESVAYDSETDIEIPVYAENAMEKYLEWDIAERDGKALSVRQWKERLYTDALRMLRSVHESTVSEIRDAWLRSSNQTFLRS